MIEVGYLGLLNGGGGDGFGVFEFWGWVEKVIGDFNNETSMIQCN
jgi:hypothetical protein